MCGCNFVYGYVGVVVCIHVGMWVWFCIYMQLCGCSFVYKFVGILFCADLLVELLCIGTSL